ncbi:MAG: hypothetical protein JWN12_344 [Candidatus Saccharibacteria bacterium]|nr:hypothetical protein [Candidatus Saccharibacteria bacterium]
MQNKRSKTGSALVVIIVVLIAVILIALGFLFWQHSMKGATNSNSDNSTKSDNTTSQQTTPPASKPAPTYVDLTDWNIKLQVPSGLDQSDVKYGENHIAEAPSYYSFNTSKIITQGGECAGGYPFGDIVSLQRTTDQQTASTEASNGGGKVINASAINSYYYYYTTSIGSTSPVPDCATTTLANSERSLLISLVESLSSL